jgi:hypothetical protein
MPLDKGLGIVVFLSRVFGVEEYDFGTSMVWMLASCLSRFGTTYPATSQPHQSELVLLDA